MVGVVNPSSSDSLDKYKSAAKGASGTKAPPAMFGGVMVESSGGSTTSGSTGSPTQSGAGASGTTSGSSPTKTGAASHMQASLGGIGAAAFGFAAFLL